jgi:hypothetical protein
MISLGNTYNEEDLNDFNERVIKKIPLSISPQGREVSTVIQYMLEFKFD